MGSEMCIRDRDGRDLPRGVFALSYFQQRPGHNAHHVVEEPVPRHRQVYLIPSLGHGAFGQGTHPFLGGDFSARSAKRRKIMGTQQPPGRLIHGCGIHRPGQLYRQPLPERIPDSALVPAVAVALGGGIIPRVGKVMSGLLNQAGPGRKPI